MLAPRREKGSQAAEHRSVTTVKSSWQTDADTDNKEWQIYMMSANYFIDDKIHRPLDWSPPVVRQAFGRRRPADRELEKRSTNSGSSVPPKACKKC